MSPSVKAKQAIFEGLLRDSAPEIRPGEARKPCVLCSGRRVSTLYMQAHFPVVRCLDCRLVYADEHFQREDLQAFYTGDYYQRAYVCHPPEIDQKTARAHVPSFNGSRAARRGGNLLDFGSARATFLSELTRRGYGDRWKMVGVDINPDEVAMGQAQGLDVRCATLGASGLPPASQDVVTAFSVLEHLQDPIETLREIASILKPGGELVAIVPSGSCLIIHLAILASKVLGRRAKNFADNVFHEEHLYYFSPKTLTLACARAGLRVDQVFYQPSYLETHPPGILVGLGSQLLRVTSWALRRQTMLGLVARKL